MLLLPPALLAQTAPPEFHFTSVDEKVLQEANELDARFEKKGLIYHDAEVDAYISRVGTQLLGDSPPLENVNFRFHVIRDPMVNAFALPNGSVYVNTGLIAALRNESQLASVLGHEITHVTGRHAYIENRSIRKKNVAIDVLLAAASAGGIRGGAFGMSVWVAGQASEIFVVASAYGYSRDLERDADHGGYGLLVHAHYDGKAMIDTFEILDERIEYEPIEPFWRTHPKLRERIATAKALALEESPAHPRETAESDYFEHLAGVIRYNIGLDLESRRARTAVDRAEHLVRWAPGDAQDISLLADAYSALGAKTAKPAGEELTAAGKKENRNRVNKHTELEEEQALAATPDGRRALAENRSKAEALYKEAMQTDPKLGDPHRGLGMLYEDESKRVEAQAEYREYLKLAPPDAIDRLRIARRLEKLQSKPEGE